MLLKIVVATLVVLLVGALLALWIARRVFDMAVTRDVARLAETLPRPVPADEAMLQALPAPVQRYLRFAIPNGRRPPWYARLEHEGDFRLQADGPWLPMQGTEHFFAGRPAFVWSGRIRMMPGLSVAVHDHYAEGRGGVDARLLGALPIARGSGREVDQSALLRLLGEVSILPSALLPSSWLRWEAMDDRHARAIVADAGVEGSGVFMFDDEGRITAYDTEDRYRTVGERHVRTPFFGRWRDYRRFGDVMAPTYGEGGWLLDGRETIYVRMRVTDVRYDAP
jgi:hypothetical protein